MAGTARSGTVSTKQARIAELAKIHQDAQTTLAHHMDLDWMREAFARTRKDGAVGVDGTTADAYEADLDANLTALLDRMKSRTYRAPPVRRVHIPKGDGSQTLNHQRRPEDPRRTPGDLVVGGERCSDGRFATMPTPGPASMPQWSAA